MAHAQFWFPSEKNPRPNAGTSYSLKVNKVIGHSGTMHSLFGDDKFFVEGFSFDQNAAILTLIVPSNLMRVDGWERKKCSPELNETWVDCFGNKWTRGYYGYYRRENTGIIGYKIQFIPRSCCSKNALYKHVLGKK